jgi:Lrp/AsnC family transcriptional regulator, leucine-responsive regulatory protein
VAARAGKRRAGLQCDRVRGEKLAEIAGFLFPSRKPFGPCQDDGKSSFMDPIDRKILKVLQTDARASLQQIGQAVGLSSSPCWERIKKMEMAGVIEGYTVRLNAQALDLNDTVMVQVTLDSHSDNTLEKFGETLAAIPEVVEAYLVSGEYDYLLRVAVKDTRDYERLLREKLYKIKGIRHSQSSFVLRTLKKADLPL